MISVILIIICTAICLWVTQRSLKNIEEKIIDNGSNYVVTVGVIFTFVGISVGLFNFDTNPNTMTVNINDFLEGMKTAFITSIVGMIFGIFIKWKQSGVEKANDDSIDKNVRAIIAGLGEIKSSIDANSTAAFQQELGGFVAAMKSFVQASADSRTDMQNLSDSIQRQVETMEQLSTTLAQSIENFGATQAARLDDMKNLMREMQASTAAAQKNSEELLRETKIYQQQSLANDDRLAKILSANTDRITEMKNSFDSFLKNMAENYSKELIRALNESMSQLNTQLQNQFGDNFKELNRAVFKVVEWQQNYMETVEKTTGELQQLNATFSSFTEKVLPKVNKNIEDMTLNLEIFADTSEKNVAVQKNLNDAAAKLNESVAQTQKIVAGFKTFSAEIIESNTAALENHLGNIQQLNQKFAAEIKKLYDTMLTVTTNSSNYLRQFNTVSEDVLREIRKTLEKFNADFSSETSKSLSILDEIFKKIAQNTDAQYKNEIKTLSASLSATIKPLIGNYNALINKIAELDRIIDERKSET
ncbi:MAG: hypothetical protein J5809_02235 [Selenomonadaceae bacterium]|nr:hypothetical protein [Selenomonadaceae bacterium]